MQLLPVVISSCATSPYGVLSVMRIRSMNGWLSLPLLISFEQRPTIHKHQHPPPSSHIAIHLHSLQLTMSPSSGSTNRPQEPRQQLAVSGDMCNASSQSTNWGNYGIKWTAKEFELETAPRSARFEQTAGLWETDENKGSALTGDTQSGTDNQSASGGA